MVHKILEPYSLQLAHKHDTIENTHHNIYYVKSKYYYNKIKYYTKSKLYFNLLSIWFNFLIPKFTLAHDLLKEKLFDNPLIIVDKKSIVVETKDWCSGFSLVSDILNKDLKTFRQKYVCKRNIKLK